MTHSTNDIQKLYLAYFSRPADLPGLQYWQQNGASLADIAASFSQSAEYTARHAGKDNSGIVQQVYYDLFARDGEPAGVAYWSGLLDKGAITIGNVVTAMLDGALNDDAVAIASKLEAMNKYCAAVAGDGSTNQSQLGLMHADIAVARAWLSEVSDAASLASAEIAIPGMVRALWAVPGANLVLSGHVQGTGPIAGASVFIDSNNNDVAELGEVSAVTDLHGFYLISDRVRLPAQSPSQPQSGGPLHVEVTVKGGVDIQTGLANQEIYTYSYDTNWLGYFGTPFKEAHIDFGPKNAHFHDAGIALTGVPAATFE